jgi:molecular chaperone GrpE
MNDDPADGQPVPPEGGDSQGVPGPETAASSGGAGADAPDDAAPPSAATDAAEDEGGGASASDAQVLAAKIEEQQAQIQGYRERWLRALADIENFRKRTRREMETATNLANAILLRELLEVLDNFERALGTTPSGDVAPDEGFQEGVRLIYGQIRGVLRQHEVTQIEADGAPFDPNLHEAVSQVETDEVPSHHVAQVVQTGYMLKDKVLRPARVVVAK